MAKYLITIPPDEEGLTGSEYLQETDESESRQPDLAGIKPRLRRTAKTSLMPPQRGPSDLRLTRQGRRHRFSGQRKLKMDIPDYMLLLA